MQNLNISFDEFALSYLKLFSNDEPYSMQYLNMFRLNLFIHDPFGYINLIFYIYSFYFKNTKNLFKKNIPP